MKNRFFLILSFLLLASVFPLAAQNGFTVSGIVMTEQGEELPGVTIQYKNNPSKGAITDVDGNFRMDNVPANTVLVFTYIGYAPQELVVNGNKTKQKIALKEIVNETDEVVIVGRGTQRKISVVGAVTNVKASDLQVPSSSVTNMLGGRVPGIIAVTRSGEPGNDFSEFWIRGISTFGAGASALVLIDGVEGDLNILDPADIESFTILKDASSTAVYGVRGANGVVLVTTKRGKSGKLNISVKSNVGLSYSARNPEYVDGYTYAQLANEASVVRGGRPVYSNAELNLIETGLDPDLYPNVNWRDVMLKDYVWNNQHHISINGGGTNARYYMSVGLQHKDAIYKQDKGIKNYDNSVGYNKYNFRANIDANLTKSTIIELGLSTEIVTNSFPGYANDTKALWQTQANLTPVTVPVLYSDGSLPAYGASADQQNPYILLNYTGYKKKNETTSSIRLRLEQDFDQWIKGLKAEATMSINNYSALTQSQTKTPALYYAQGRNKDGSLNLIEKVAKTDDKYESTNLSTRKIYFDARVNYNRPPTAAVWNAISRSWSRCCLSWCLVKISRSLMWRRFCKMKLLEIAHSRTGDKGDISNISVIAYDMKDYEFIKEKVTVELVAKVFAGYCRGTVTRYELPKIGALNFVLTKTLGGGVTRSLRLDTHGKCLCSYLLDVELDNV